MMLGVWFYPPRIVDNTDVYLFLTVPRERRQWKPFSFHLKGFPLYFSPVSVVILLEIGIANGPVGCYQSL